MEPSRRGALTYEMSLPHSIRCYIHINQKHSDFLFCFVFNKYLNTRPAVYLIFINTLVCRNAAYSVRLEENVMRAKLCNCTLHRPIGKYSLYHLPHFSICYLSIFIFIFGG